MVYITSDLFGPPTSHNPYTGVQPAQHTIMANPQHTAGLGKRKRIMDDDTVERRPGSVQHPHSHCSHMGAVGSHRGSPSHHTPHLAFRNNNNNNNNSLTYTVCSAKTSERRPMKQMKRQNPQITLTKSTSHLMDMDTEPLPQPTLTIRPCHACNSAPKRKRDLDSYSDCRRCEERTCYICARQCIGGCGKTVCKKCTVEVGEEGDAWCLDCYARNLNC